MDEDESDSESEYEEESGEEEDESYSEGEEEDEAKPINQDKSSSSLLKKNATSNKGSSYKKLTDKSYDLNEIVEVRPDKKSSKLDTARSQSESEEEFVSHESQKAEDVAESESKVSSNRSSSAASELQFNRSIKRLVKYMQDRIKRYMFIFKASLLLTICILVITSALIFDTISNAMIYYEEIAHYVNLVGDLRYYS